MFIAITAAILISIGFGAFIVLFAASAITRQTVELDRSLEEQPMENWGLNSGVSTLTTRMTTQ
ncbi:MAG: hypothetical protein M9936_01870 [Caldilinea sp.]|nr:hypothetical protein [Caldilinea sp.]MCB0059812.1 hypothetical protein [Caldilineaceae bacterium]MCB0038316.1 hypothetical protein [Caldilinea sp.]MCB0050354.1 hypothetical protein [Caldilinea sp.]MCB0067789.1 hypothetical protein [Caldilineaceae bacterium]